MPGSYSAYQQRAKAIRVQARELGDTEWPDQFTDWPLNPANTLWSVLASGITASSTSISLTVPLDRVNELLVDQPAYWIVDGEVFLAIATNNGAGSVTLTVVAHNGVDDASLGQGFVTSAAGRGLDGTDAANHSSGATVVLASASLAPGDLRPDTDYELRVALVNASAQAGPWSDIVGVTTWKQPIPPAAPVFLASPEGVQQLGHDIQAQWTPVTTDASGEFRSDVKRYIVVRALTSLGATFAIATYGNDMTMTELQTAVNAAGATIVADTPASVVSIPATKGNGNWIGVAAVGSEGLFSQWDWDSDTLAPPTPDPDDVIIYEVEEGIAFQVPENSTSINAQTGAAIASPAHRDTGWVEYLLWQAGTSSGGSAVIVGRMRASSGVVAITGGTTGYYKITSVDGAGNMGEASAPNNAGWSSGWKLIFSRFAELGLPPNGNFQIPDQAGTNAKGWTPNINGGVTGMDFVYQNTGGLEGNKVYRFIVPSSPPSGPFGNEEGVVAGDLLRVIPATTGTGVVGTMWLYQDSGSTKQYLCYLGFAGSSDDDTWLADAGSFILETPSAVSIPSGTWTKVTINSVYDTLESNARSGRWLAWFRAVPGVGSGTDYSIYMDALKVTF